MKIVRETTTTKKKRLNHVDIIHDVNALVLHVIELREGLGFPDLVLGPPDSNLPGLVSAYADEMTPRKALGALLW